MYLDELHDVVMEWVDWLVVLAVVVVLVAAASYGASRVAFRLPASVTDTVSRACSSAASLAKTSWNAGMSLAAVDGRQFDDP